MIVTIIVNKRALLYSCVPVISRKPSLKAIKQSQRCVLFAREVEK
jgi:hypothetical protein